jgi:hypothetical protein
VILIRDEVEDEEAELDEVAAIVNEGETVLAGVKEF